MENDQQPVMYFGREVKSYIPTNMPVAVMIDVMQKQGDCPQFYSDEEKQRCLGDCQSTFVTAIYDIMQKQIVGWGVLSRGHVHIKPEIAQKHGLTINDIRSLMSDVREHLEFDGKSKRVTIDDHITIEKLPSAISVNYNGELLLDRRDCVFSVGEANLRVAEPEIVRYMQLIGSNPEKIMAECGIRLEDYQGASVVTYSKKENRQELPTDNLIPDEI